MNLKPTETVISVAAAKAMGNMRLKTIAWSPNNLMLAVCRPDKVVYLFDEGGGLRDKFITRARSANAVPGTASATSTSGPTSNGSDTNIKESKDGKEGKETKEKIHDVTAITFSPDSIKLAIGQSDGMLYIYKIGEDFKMKKSITSKYQQMGPVTTLCWPNDMEIFCGLADGKLRYNPTVNRKGPRTRTVFSGESICVAITTNAMGTELLSSHADGKIAFFSIGNPEGPVLLTTIRHTCPPTCLLFCMDLLMAAGCDKRIHFYDRQGRMRQKIDLSKDWREHELTCAATSGTGQTILVGGFNRVKVLQYVNRRKCYEVFNTKKFKNMNCIANIDWKNDGAAVAISTSVGSLYLFDTVFRRAKNKRFEITYVTPSHVTLKLLDSQMTITVNSRYSAEILDVQVMGKDNYAVARTMHTLIIYDLRSEMVSEIPWSDTGDRERFYFENPDVCMIFNQGELVLVEYGMNEILGSFRTELVNPHTISVRINERFLKSRRHQVTENKKLAYLMDLKTIAVVDLVNDLILGHINHDFKIDWLELNETGTRLLFRDRKTHLLLVDVETMHIQVLDLNCSFVQWVPGSDVVVAQCKHSLKVWYNVDTPEQYHEIEIKGQALEVIKEENRTFVNVLQGTVTTEVELDEDRIEFVTSVDAGDLIRAILFLETCPANSESEAMWNKLARAAVDLRELKIAQRAYARLGDIPRAKFLSETIDLCEEIDEMNPDEIVYWRNSHVVEARMCLLEGQLKTAEAVYIAHDDIDGAVTMYETMLKYDEAVTLAKAKAHPRSRELIEDFLKRLVRTGQYEMAAEFLESHGDIVHSVKLYLEGGCPTKAAKLLQKYPHTRLEKEISQQISGALLQGDFFEEAGDYFELTGQKTHALECYRKGKLYDKAVKLAKYAFPNDVVQLEEEWGDYLAGNRQLDAATNHYIEAGKLLKGLDAAIESRQFKKALQIIKVMDDSESVKEQYGKIGDYYKQVEEYGQAEKCYLNGGVAKRAIDMYGAMDLWEEAYRVAAKVSTDKAELHEEYFNQAKLLQDEGKMIQAERLYMAIGEADAAINMYAKAKMYDDVMRLVSKHHPEHLEHTMKHVADIMAKEESFRSAEHYYIKANKYEEAVKMYSRKKHWEDAYRVARSNGGVPAGKLVIYEWAETLGGEMALRLLKKFNYLNDGIDHFCTVRKFQFALDIAKLGAEARVSEVHVRWGKDAEGRSDYKLAVTHYMAAEKPKLAIEMYIRANMLDEAVDLADEHAKEDLPQILLIQAKQHFSQKNFSRFEQASLRAEKPEFALEMYKTHDMWTDAFRLAKEYAPHAMKSLQADYDARGIDRMMKGNPSAVIGQAKEFERIGEYRRAVECYLQLDEAQLDNKVALARCWGRAADLAMKFLKKSDVEQIIGKMVPKLISCQMHGDAAALFFHLGLVKDGIECYISGNRWEDARRAAKDSSAEMEEYVKLRHTEVLRKTGQVDELTNVNLAAALDLLCEQGEWTKCLERARKYDSVLAVYQGRYITHLLKNRQPVDCLEVYKLYGAPATKQHYPLYKALCAFLFNDTDLDNYGIWAIMRTSLFDLVVKMNAGPDARSKISQHMEKLLTIVHYFATRAAFNSVPQMKPYATKLSISLLRYIGLIPCDRAFYEAGIMCKAVGWNNMAFVFLNHYLDIRDAIDQGVNNLNKLDNRDFALSDIPYQDCELPPKHTIPSQCADDIKEWVLTASMDKEIQQEIRFDDRNCFEGSLVTLTPSNYGLHEVRGQVFEPCVITGYPVIGQRVNFPATRRMANKEDWNVFIMAAKTQGIPEFEDILKFIADWCGSTPNYTF